VFVYLNNDSFSIAYTHRDYDLLSGGALSCYTEFWFTFETWIINDLIDFRNLFRGKFGKSFLNLHDFTDVAFRGLSVIFAIGVRI